jgi:ubiquinone/menaquinone biosynthesis C-methylase UbiE
MNALENWFCATGFWRRVTQKRLLPWIVSGSTLGDHVLELGSGPGAGTQELRRRAPRVTSLEYSHTFAANLAARNISTNGSVLQGDASVLPFAEQKFSSVIAVLMLHHLRSSEQQERAFREVFRVLRPGGGFFAFEIQDGWFNRAIHRNSTFVPVRPAAIPEQLTIAGFSKVTVDSRRGGFRLQAFKTVG